jgi:hypothetical protein
MREPADMIGCLLRGPGDDWHVQAMADHHSGISGQYVLVGDRLIPGACGPVLKHEPVEMGSIEPVHGGPTVEPVDCIRRNAPFTRDQREYPPSSSPVTEK